MIWQPIATAPQDGTAVLLYHPGFKGAFYPSDEQPRWWVDRMRDGRWWQAAPSAMPTHWMPLPPAPTDGVEASPPPAKPWWEQHHWYWFVWLPEQEAARGVLEPKNG